jgi:hypothetical protein
MQSNGQGRGQRRLAVVTLAGVLWLACDGESPSMAPSLAPPPATSESSGTLDAGANGAEEPSLPSIDESSDAGRAPDDVDVGAPEADARGGVALPDGGLPLGNDCCTESALPGCSNAPVLECVCAGDAACCNESYDALCVTEAITRCALACELPPPESDCSTPSEVPSCSVPEIAECVCAIDPFCCAFRFDANCVTLAAAECIGAQPPGQGAQP